jgi:hypothetical protein
MDRSPPPSPQEVSQSPTAYHPLPTALDGKTTLASAFLVRGKVPLADFLTCVSTAQRSLHFPAWNPDACKIGMCSTPHPGEIFSALGVFNRSSTACLCLSLPSLSLSLSDKFQHCLWDRLEPRAEEV